jgi:hypothetical protein
MPEITPEQKEHLKTWAGQRDALLADISALQSGKEKAMEVNRNLADSNTEIQSSIYESEGRLAELLAKEKEFEILTFRSIAPLQAQKTELETAITGLKNEIALLKENKTLLLEGNTELKDAHDRAFDRINSIDKIVEHVTRISSANISDIEKILETFKASVENLTATNTKNVEATNVVIGQLPRVFFDVQRQSLKRKQI